MTGLDFKRVVLRITVCCAFGLAISPKVSAGLDAGDTLPVLELYPGAKASWIARQMTMNGLPISIRAIATEASPNQVLEFYRGRWMADGRRHIARSSFDGFEAIGVNLDGHFASVQVRATNRGAEGMLVVSATAERATPDRSTAFPLAPGDRLWEKIETEESGTVAETLIIISDRSLAGSISAYQQQLGRLGWVDTAELDSTSGRDTRQLSYQRHAQLCRLTVTEAGITSGTRILVHWVRSHAD